MSSFIDQLTDVANGFKVSHATVVEDVVAQGSEVSYTTQRLMGRHSGFRVGAYYFSPIVALSSSTVAAASGLLFAQTIPFGIQLVDTLAMEVTVFAGNARMGLYEYNYTTGLPGALIVDAGEVALSSNAIKEWTFTQRTVGDCWVAAIFDSAPTMRSGAAGQGGSLIGSTDFQTARKGLQVAQTYGALPNPFPAGAGVSTIAPLMAVKRAA